MSVHRVGPRDKNPIDESRHKTKPRLIIAKSEKLGTMNLSEQQLQNTKKQKFRLRKQIPLSYTGKMKAFISRGENKYDKTRITKCS